MCRIPLFRVTDALGILKPGTGHKRNIAQATLAEIPDDRPGRVVIEMIGLLLQVSEVLIGELGKHPIDPLLWVKMLLVDGLLADDGVEIESSLGHPGTGSGGDVATGIDERVTTLVFACGETFSDQHFRSITCPPRFPPVVRISEHRV